MFLAVVSGWMFLVDNFGWMFLADIARQIQHILPHKGEADNAIINTVLPHDIFQHWVWFLEEKGKI